MLNFKANFKEHYLKISSKENAFACSLCGKHEDNQQNIIDCEKTEKRLVKITKKEYESLFSENLDTDVLIKYKELWKQRENLLEEKEKKSS